MKEFVLSYQDKLYRFALRMLGNVQDAEDVIQELYIKIWKKLEKFEKLENQEAWCMTVTRNMAIDKIRSRKKRQYIDISEAYDISDNNKDPYAKAVQSDAYKMLDRWMGKLPEKQRITIHLREIEGMTYKEIAAVTSLSLEQVKSNIFRGRQALKEIFIKSKIKI